MRRITGTMINYYFICKRKLWLFAHDITMEADNEDVIIGKVIDEQSYARQNKGLSIDGVINIDFVDSDLIIHEVKKSMAGGDAAIWQTKYYLYIVQQRGLAITKAQVNVPKQKKIIEVELEQGDDEKIKNLLDEIECIIASAVPPPIINKSLCKKCAYYELCYV